MMEERFGVFSYDMAHLLGTAVLVLSFGLLYQRRTKAVVNIYGAQAIALAAAAAWQGYVQDAPQLYITALITFAAKGVAIPLAMHRIIDRSIAGIPLVVELCGAVLILVAFVVFGVFFFRIRERFDSLDIGHFDSISRMHR